MKLKITYNCDAPGSAKVGRRREPGQWIVFDRDVGSIPGTHKALFHANTFAECCDWIDKQRRT